VSSGQSKISLT
jgi:hypothetical protein